MPIGEYICPLSIFSASVCTIKNIYFKFRGRRAPHIPPY